LPSKVLKYSENVFSMVAEDHKCRRFATIATQNGGSLRMM